MKKEEGAAGSVLGDGSFLRREGVPVLGERTKRKGVYWLLVLAQLLGKKSTPETRYRC